MPFGADDCWQTKFVDDDGIPMSLCARAIVAARKVDDSIPLCNKDCPIDGPADLRRNIHDKCAMSLTTREATDSGLNKKVNDALTRTQKLRELENRGGYDLGVESVIELAIKKERRERQRAIRESLARKISKGEHSANEAMEELFRMYFPK